MAPDPDEAWIRIGELSRRVGIGTDRLRAWERRYGLLQPHRSQGGFRLYSAADEQRVHAMQRRLEQGLSAAQAAQAVLATTPATSPPGALRRRLATALGDYDDTRVTAVLDEAFATLGPDATTRDVIFPHLREVGDAWARAELDIADEHFASSLFSAALLARTRAASNGRGPRAVLACAPGEQHRLGLIGLSLALHTRGWRVSYLGADTPIAETTRVAERIQPELVLISATLPALLPPYRLELQQLAGAARLILAGPGVAAALADRVGAERIDVDPVTAAEQLATR